MACNYGVEPWNSWRTIGLDGVLAQQENYRKSGFQLAYRNIRYCGTFTGVYAGSTAGSRSALFIVPISSVDQAESTFELRLSNRKEEYEPCRNFALSVIS